MNSNLNLSKLKEETKRNIENIINDNNLSRENTQTQQAVVKSIKSISKKSINNIEPDMKLKDPKRNNYTRYRTPN